MIILKRIVPTLLLLLCTTQISFGHGINLVLVNGQPGYTSAASTLDLVTPSASRTPGYSNLFIDSFGSTASTNIVRPTDSAIVGTTATPFYFAQGGGPQAKAGFPAYTSITFKILSPLYFSNGTGPATLAAAGTSIQFYDQWPNNPLDPLYSPSNLTTNPGAGSGAFSIDGTTGMMSSPFNLSGYNTHEMGKRLFGTQTTTGEYGFAYEVLATLADNTVYDSGTIKEVFQLTDPTLTGGSFSLAPKATQDAATQALYTALPEPSSFTLAILACVSLPFMKRLRRKS